MLKSDVVGVGGKVGWSGYLVVVEMGWVDERKLSSASPLYTFLKAWPSTGTHAKHRTKARTRKRNDVGHDDVSRHLGNDHTRWTRMELEEKWLEEAISRHLRRLQHRFRCTLWSMMRVAARLIIAAGK